jgi:hypothetical protein
MEPKSAAKRTAGRDDHPEDERDSAKPEPEETGSADPEDEEGAIAELDLDDIDAPFDPDFAGAEAWERDALAQDDGVEDDTDEPVDDEFEDEAEMKLLHELGIDLDAPDGESDVELELDITHEDPADDGVAA